MTRRFTRRASILSLGAALTGFALALWLVSALFARVQATETHYRMIADAMTLPEAAQTLVAWEPPAQPLARPFTVYDQERIGQALTEAWAALAVSQDLGDGRALADHFSGVALERAGVAARMAQAQDTRMAVLAQRLRPVLYHLDGSVLQVRGETLAVRFTQDEGAAPQVMMARDQTVTTLLNESSGWRVVSHERQSTTPATTEAAPVLLPRLAGINYYPAQTPWRAFWPNYDPSVIARDLDLIVSLGANAVRLFIPRDVVLDPRVAPDFAEDLADFLSQAQARGLSVVPTLFDLRGGYAPTLWADDALYISRLAPILAASPAVAMIDLKNEPDLDFDRHGRATVLAWAETMAHLLRQNLPGVPLTVGWASPESAGLLLPVLDVVTYHDYQPPEGTAERLAAVRQLAGTRPVMVTEIGASSFSALFGFPGSEDAQAQDLATRLEALADADGAFVWALHDFPRTDVAAIGASPWNTALQARFGLFGESDSPKPAAAAVSQGFARLLQGDPR